MNEKQKGNPRNNTKKKRPKAQINKAQQNRKRVNNTSFKKKKKLRKRRKQIKSTRELWKEIGVTIFIVLFLFIIMAATIFALPKSEGYGMAPIVNDGERVFVNRFGTVRRFDLIYFKIPDSEEKSIRRVIGLPGESVQYKNDQLFINQQETIERFLQSQLKRAEQNEELLTDDFRLSQIPNTKLDRIPKGKYLVLGDNRPYSTDSRYYGLVDEKEIIGTVEMRIWPIHKLTSY
ncbi:signal peptidase I [Enterococcus sp. DIV0840]|uniref:signal peptidase I n=1 Tax=Enterococcus TaxID=1350 RepID=UPI001A8D1287|nr:MULTISPECIES: signal peptidase I [Enterococcus]MBO0435490.1 signal peptidase I [Enterococcus sp. DIV0849a]MBO0473356.1 signal peptidase I [Enterococcus ureasiticus]